MAEPFLLVREGTSKPIAQACGKCGRVYQLNDAFAERCCDPRCADCGGPADKGWVCCEPCRSKREAAREAERVAKAVSMPESEYSGPVFWDGGPNEGFAQDVDEFRDHWESDRDDPLPLYVWACTETRREIPSADTIIENASQDSFEDCYERMMDGDTDALQKAIDAFNDSISCIEWNPDYSRRIVLAPTAVAK
jgi:hypothetical protein